MPELDVERSQGRVEVERTERRRRSDTVLAKDAKLPIPPEVSERLKAEGLHPRWVNDEGNRMHRFTVQDDYDKVPGVEPVPVGTAKDGSPIMAHLLAKPIAFMQDDQRNADKRRRDVEDTLTRTAEDTAAKRAAGENPNPGTAQRYIDPASKISRNRVNQVSEG